ncbi:XRE family transcriptional regulator [Flavobacterium arcticum]|uniref:XRE family transcriptional regulator n=1 Tax=Flavobacterium arcticum TaxID=1784713 RepID=A0A345HDS3_9FLAO|nr:helix-turn-helix transcriptional regulator [Flavobacterium arcticum]AXG74733.1 XRE family transcriptional regulator [Flavobacterium arcticum]KAF2509767.1 helix-turn-helix transcriptional regulator [Flavobacterium arcticum]
MKNFIGLNIKYLCENNFLSQDEFGAKFGLKKSVVGTYIRGISYPKIEVIQKICEEFNLTIDEFINEDLYIKYKGYTAGGSLLKKVNEPEAPVYETEKEALLKAIEAQQQTIAAMKVTIDTLLHK